MKERFIFEAALQAVNRITGQELFQVIAPTKRAGHGDFELRLGENSLRACIKKWAPQTKPGILIHQLQRRAEKSILVADYINPAMGETLQQAGVQYIDSVGNAFIDQPSVFICIKGNKPEKVSSSHKPGKAFQSAGLKIIHAFISDADLLNSSYRTIAEKAGTALATVGDVIRGLEQAGYLKTSAGKRQLINRDQLQQQWVEAYPHKLREKHYIGTFTTDNPLWWQSFKPDEFDGLWEGEVAAAEYTHYLNPKNAIVYISRNSMAGLMKAAKLRKVKPHEYTDFEIKLFEPFWPETSGYHHLAPPLVTYADLLETGESRNIETANKLYEKYLRW